LCGDLGNVTIANIERRVDEAKPQLSRVIVEFRVCAKLEAPFADACSRRSSATPKIYAFYSETGMLRSCWRIGIDCLRKEYSTALSGSCIQKRPNVVPAPIVQVFG
jgi:hypothetical protein